MQKALQGITLQLFLWAEGVTALGAGISGSPRTDQEKQSNSKR
jgi:hypothetical protein